MVGRKESLHLSAGRAMDILVAEQVMGWRLETDRAKLKRLNQYFVRDETRQWWRTPEGGWRDYPPPYSSDIAAAWQVVEKMSGRGQALILFHSVEGNKVAFGEPWATDPDYITELSVPDAICRAALLAVTGQVKV